MIEKTDATAAGSSDNAKNVTGISDADLSAEITKTITKTVEDYNLANIKKNLSMTQVSEMIPTIFLLLKDILTKINSQSDALNSVIKNVELEKEVSGLKKEIIDLQYDKVKNQVRVSGLNLHQNANNGRENQNQSYEVVDKLITDMAIEESPTSYECWRIPPKPNSTNLPTMLISFYYASDHASFFRSLKNLKGNRDYWIHVNQNFPQSLSARLNVLTTQAKSIRSTTDKLTSIRYKKSNLELHTKDKGTGGTWTLTDH